MADSVKDMTTKFGKLDKFEGSDFRRWQKKMHFLLTTLKVAYVLSTPRPEFVEEETLEQTRKRCKWDNDDYICRGHILNGMSDALFDVYQNVELAKELWDQLEAKYMAEDTSSKKFLVSNFNIYRMVDSRSVMEQYHELVQILGQYTQHGLFMDESILVSSIIDKLSPSWKDFKHMLKHNKDELSLVQLGSHFRIEETLRMKKDDEIAWWIDSGATCHACKDRCWFDTFHPVEDGSIIHMGDKSTKPILGRGNVVIEFSSGKTITLFNVVYVPGLRKNLMSGPVLNKCGYRQVYESNKYILSRHGVFIGFGYYNNGMFMLNLNKVPSSINSVYMAYSHVVDSKVWHARLGHVHYNRLHDMSKDSLIPSFDKNMEKCNTCMLTKITRQPFKDIKRNSILLELIHSDLCDFHATPSIGNKKYVVTFIDDASRFCYVYLLHAKDEALDKFKIYKTEVELQQNNLIKTLRTDRGGEYYDPSYFQSVGIIHQTTAPYTPQQNGVSERKNRALKEMVNSMLSYSGLSEGFWGEAMLTACYLLNRVPNKNNKITPYELWYKKRPNLSYLRVWGCRAVVRLPEPKKKILGEKGIDCIFIGYAEHSKAYRFYVIEPNDSVSVNSVIESRDAIFDENRFSSIPRPKDIVSSSNGTQGGDLPGETPIEIPEPRRSNRARVAKSYGSDFQLYLVEGSRDEIASQYSYCYSTEEDPKTFDEAMKSRDIAFWKEAIDDEIGSIMENNTWVLSNLPLGCKPLGCKWIFKRKMKVDGTIDKFKARLVIQGFRQKERIDYFDTYAPVARNEHKVCKLIKSLYGLKQAPKQWHHKFNDVVLSNGFVSNQSEKCVYCKFDESSNGVIICLFVDDMLIFGTNQTQVDKTKEFLSSNFSMKDIREADAILGIRIKRENKGLTITQSHYIEKIPKKFNCEGCGPVSTPMEAGIKLMPHVGKPVNQLEYSRAIGCLMYAITSTRPDIAYDVGKLSRFTSNPSIHHWEAITRVSWYLKNTMNYGLSYVGFPLIIEGYSYASWITNSEDHTSTTGWVFLLGGGAISWASKKQTCITDSTMESEFVALAAAGKEAEWLRNLIYEIPLWPKPISPISIHCDSAATLAKAYSQIYNGKSRHLGVRHNMVRELITNGVISVDFVRSQQNLADHLTKGLARDLVHKSAIGMGLKCKTKRTTYVSMECRRFKKLGLGFLYAHEGYGRKAL
ncbi:zinc finger, CCHC-type containing protein [Tanacetum coccineum]